ncbi:EamA family transporter [Thalassomonas viridans]|uniref:EamA family transporter n=2 Tax=Thalassomonas viridans TaxID=137584 RepID=A0AAE9Z8J7_9GAMM|nr:EamA family transporter [Thalassomonas viridans]WDE08139.1 EamA family transporter [Thalassomonas viridans]
MATIYGLLAIVMWGALALLGVNTKGIPAFQLLFLCFFISGLLMFVRRFLTGQPLFQKPAMSLPQWLFGTGALFGFHFCYFLALKHAPAIEVSLICYLWPMLLAILLAGKSTRLRALAGGVLGFLGIGFIILGDADIAFNGEYVSGYLLAGACALIWSGYSWYLSKSSGEPDDIGWLSLAVAFLSLLAHFLLEDPAQSGGRWQFGGEQWLGIILLGLGPVGGAFYLWDLGLKKGNQKLLASLSFCSPLISSVLLALAGYNAWSLNILIALTLILLGALIANKKPANKRINTEENKLPSVEAGRTG